MVAEQSNRIFFVPAIIVPPFTYDEEGFKVDGYVREAGDRLYELLPRPETPWQPTDDETIAFFSAKAIHYGLQVGDIDTDQTSGDPLLSALGNEGQTELHVPEKIKDLEWKMASLFERR